MISIIAFVIVIFGAFNWLSIGMFQYDIVAGLFGYQGSIFSRIIYVIVGISACFLTYSVIKNKGRLNAKKLIHEERVMYDKHAKQEKAIREYEKEQNKKMKEDNPEIYEDNYNENYDNDYNKQNNEVSNANQNNNYNNQENNNNYRQGYNNQNISGENNNYQSPNNSFNSGIENNQNYKNNERQNGRNHDNITQ